MKTSRLNLSSKKCSLYRKLSIRYVYLDHSTRLLKNGLQVVFVFSSALVEVQLRVAKEVEGLEEIRVAWVLKEEEQTFRQQEVIEGVRSFALYSAFDTQLPLDGQ